jgi:4-amino-4-deoxy-L-arabinose transferase-like glycosyltransferase
MNQPLWWDEADYLSASKKWGLGVNVGDIWYYRRGFLFPLIGALLFKLGIGEIGLRFSEVIFSTGLVIVSYFLIAKMFDKKKALLTSICLACSWIYIFFTGRVLTDIPSAFFLLLSLLFFWKGYVLKEGNKFIYFFGLFFALATLIRMQSLMFAIPLLIYILIKEKFKMFKNKRLWIAFGIFAIMLVPQFILYASKYGNPVQDILAHYFGIEGASSGEYLPKTASTLFDYILNLPYILGGQVGFGKILFFLFLAGAGLFLFDFFLGIDKLLKNEEIQKRLLIILWIAIPFLILGYITVYVEQRYASACLVFLFFIAVTPLIKISDFLSSKSKNEKKNYLALAVFVVIILIIPNIAWGNTLTEQKIPSYLEIQQAGIWIKENSNSSDMVITQSRPQMVYYAERSVQNSTSKILEDEPNFEKEMVELKPRYLVLSSYEQSPDWLYNYPQNHPDKLIPVQTYPQTQQPMVIIYEFKYN